MLLRHWFWFSIFLTAPSAALEYCQFENFNPSCNDNNKFKNNNKINNKNNNHNNNKINNYNNHKNIDSSNIIGIANVTAHHDKISTEPDTINIVEVIMVESAFYGRMREGRCVSKSYGHLGCYHDVTMILGAVCDGKVECLVPVPLLRELVEPCPRDLISYLNVSFRCMQVEYLTRETCVQPSTYKLYTPLTNKWVLPANNNAKNIETLANNYKDPQYTNHYDDDDGDSYHVAPTYKEKRSYFLTDRVFERKNRSKRDYPHYDDYNGDVKSDSDHTAVLFHNFILPIFPTASSYMSVQSNVVCAIKVTAGRGQSISMTTQLLPVFEQHKTARIISQAPDLTTDLSDISDEAFRSVYTSVLSHTRSSHCIAQLLLHETDDHFATSFCINGNSSRLPAFPTFFRSKHHVVNITLSRLTDDFGKNIRQDEMFKNEFNHYKKLHFEDRSNFRSNKNTAMGKLNSSFLFHWFLLIRLQVHGCSNPHEVLNAEMVRQENSLTIKCIHDQKVFHLACVNNTWLGTVGNCSEKLLTSKKKIVLKDFKTLFPVGLAVVVAVGVSLGFLLGTIALSCLHLQKRRMTAPIKSTYTKPLMAHNLMLQMSSDNSAYQTSLCPAQQYLYGSIDPQTLNTTQKSSLSNQYCSVKLDCSSYPRLCSGRVAMDGGCCNQHNTCQKCSFNNARETNLDPYFDVVCDNVEKRSDDNFNNFYNKDNNDSNSHNRHSPDTNNSFQTSQLSNAENKSIVLLRFS